MYCVVCVCESKELYCQCYEPVIDEKITNCKVCYLCRVVLVVQVIQSASFFCSGTAGSGSTKIVWTKLWSTLQFLSAHMKMAGRKL